MSSYSTQEVFGHVVQLAGERGQDLLLLAAFKRGVADEVAEFLALFSPPSGSSPPKPGSPGKPRPGWRLSTPERTGFRRNGR